MGSHNKPVLTVLCVHRACLATPARSDARDVQQTGGASTSVPFQARYRQHAQQQEQHQQGQRQSEPEWARTNVTEATRAFQRHDPSAYIDRGARPSRMQRTQFEPLESSITFDGHGPSSPENYRRRVTNAIELPRTGGKAASLDDKPAGGRPNMSGPSDKNGNRRNLIANGVSFLYG